MLASLSGLFFPSSVLSPIIRVINTCPTYWVVHPSLPLFRKSTSQKAIEQGHYNESSGESFKRIRKLYRPQPSSHPRFSISLWHHIDRRRRHPQPSSPKEAIMPGQLPPSMPLRLFANYFLLPTKTTTTAYLRRQEVGKGERSNPSKAQMSRRKCRGNFGRIWMYLSAHHSLHKKKQALQDLLACPCPLFAHFLYIVYLQSPSCSRSVCWNVLCLITRV